MSDISIKTVAFVTYNTVGGSLASGWHEGRCGRKAFVLQNSKGETWAAANPDSYTRAPGEGATYTERREAVIHSLWGQLREVLPEIDMVVVYVGASGSECAIALAAKLPASRVTIVTCGCSLCAKQQIIADHGLSKAQWVYCECGGHESMRRLYETFMETGALRR